MLHSSTKQLRFLPLFALAAGMLASAIACSSVRADTIGDQKVGAIRLGVYYSASSGVRNTFTSSIGSAGLDVNLGSTVGTSRSVLSVDYISRSSGSSKLQIIPLTISEQYYRNIGGTDWTPYGEAGIGGYFIQDQDQNNSSLLTTHAKTSLGAFIGGGFDISESIFVDLRYHLIQNLHGDDPSGYELTAGYRF
jgi:opacity protein-like surface antigen